MHWGTFSLVVGLTLGRLAGAADVSPQELLQRADISTLAPASFVAHLSLTDTTGKTRRLEVWRAGEARTLVRFLGPKDQGKFLLKRDGVLWFLSPRAKKPVRLDPSYKLAGGASLDEILGLRYSREYTVARATAGEDGLSVLDLEGAGPGVRYPRVRYLVRRSTQRPVRVEFLSASGRTLGSVEFQDWGDGPRPRPRRLLVTDNLRPKEATAVEITDVTERSISEEIFDLEHSDARIRLEAASPP